MKIHMMDASPAPGMSLKRKLEASVLKPGDRISVPWPAGLTVDGWYVQKTSTLAKASDGDLCETERRAVWYPTQEMTSDSNV